MGSEYPDVLGDLVEARNRSEVNGVHYVAALEPDTIAPGGATALRVWLQSCWDAPVDVAITVQLPTPPSGTFSAIQKRTDVPLQAAEVGQVMVPIGCAAQTPPGEYHIPILLGVKFEVRGLYIRSQKNDGLLGETLLSTTTGMGLAAAVGLGFSARTRPEQVLPLRVQGPPHTGHAPDLTPTFLSHWTVDDLRIQGKARQLVNDQQLYLLPQLTRQALYLAFLNEGQARFRDAALPLHIGEAIFLAKILTFTVEYFLRHANGRDAILLPAYMLAVRYNLPTNDPIFLITRADYARVTRLAMSLSFGLLHRRMDRAPWTREEQLALADLVADRVERGGVLPAEFLYLPLLLGGLMVAHEVQMPGENVAQSFGLLANARRQRATDLADNPELNDLLDRLLQTAQGAP